MLKNVILNFYKKHSRTLLKLDIKILEQKLVQAQSQIDILYERVLDKQEETDRLRQFLQGKVRPENSPVELTPELFNCCGSLCDKAKLSDQVVEVLTERQTLKEEITMLENAIGNPSKKLN